MDLSREILLKESRSRKFRPEILEKTFRLTDLLGAIDKHPFLKDRIALKGGTHSIFFFSISPSSDSARSGSSPGTVWRGSTHFVARIGLINIDQFLEMMGSSLS
jgi:hypothetical protein